jgi:hypothetical protein
MIQGPLDQISFRSERDRLDSGTSITKLDVAGTLTIIVGVVGVVVFGNIRIKTDAIFMGDP